MTTTDRFVVRVHMEDGETHFLKHGEVVTVYTREEAERVVARKTDRALDAGVPWTFSVEAAAPTDGGTGDG